MESDVSFNIEDRVNDWVNSIKNDPAITESDAEELRTHFFDQIDDLKKVGLNDKEAFWVASNRMNINEDVALDYKHTNNNMVQMRWSLIILGGVLMYFLIYTFIKCSNNILFITSLSLSDSDSILAINLIKRYLTGWHFIVIFFFASLFFMEKRTISIIEKIRLKPWHTIFILLLTGIFYMSEVYTLTIVKRLIRDNIYLTSEFIHINRNVGISFPLLLCLGFICIYFKYYKKNNI